MDFLAEEPRVGVSLDSLPTDASGLTSFDWEEFFMSFLKKLMNVGIRLLLSLVLLIVGLLVVKLIIKLVGKIISKTKMDQTLAKWLLSVLGFALKFFLVVIFIDSLGIETLTITGIVAALGLAFGAALSSIVKNLAAGLILIIMKPMKVGEWVRVGGPSGVNGTVVAINITTTHIITFDNKLHIVPNIVAQQNVLTNYSRMDIRRLDFNITVPAATKIAKLRELLLNALYDSTISGKILREPQGVLRVSAIEGGKVTVMIGVWIHNVTPEMYERIKWHANEVVLRTLKQNGLPLFVGSLKVYLQEGAPNSGLVPPKEEQEKLESIRQRIPKIEEKQPNDDDDDDETATLLQKDFEEGEQKRKEKLRSKEKKQQ